MRELHQLGDVGILVLHYVTDEVHRWSFWFSVDQQGSESAPPKLRPRRSPRKERMVDAASAVMLHVISLTLDSRLAWGLSLCPPEELKDVAEHLGLRLDCCQWLCAITHLQLRPKNWDVTWAFISSLQCKNSCQMSDGVFYSSDKRLSACDCSYRCSGSSYSLVL